MKTWHLIVGGGLLCSACGAESLLGPSSSMSQAQADAAMARVQEDARQRELAEEKERAKRQTEATAATDRILRDARDRDESRKRVQACAPKWRPKDIKDAEAARLRAAAQPASSIPDGIPAAPSDRYRLFDRFAATLENQLALGCDVAGRGEFDVEWTYLKEEEASRLSRLAELEQQAATRRAEREAERAAFEEEYAVAARKHGIERVEFGSSLSDALRTLIEEAAPVSSLKRVAIEFGYADQGFVAQQSLGGGQAIFATSDSDIRLWVVAPSVAMYEGTPLSALVSEDQPCFVVTGTKSYRTVAGSVAQAFVVKPAW